MKSGPAPGAGAEIRPASHHRWRGGRAIGPGGSPDASVLSQRQRPNKADGTRDGHLEACIDLLEKRGTEAVTSTGKTQPSKKKKTKKSSTQTMKR